SSNLIAQYFTLAHQSITPLRARLRACGEASPAARDDLALGAHFRCNRAARNLLSKALDSRDGGPIIARVFFTFERLRDRDQQEVIMTGKRNYFPCVDLKNLHIPLT